MEISPGHIHQVKWFESDMLEGIVKKKLEITFRKDRTYPGGKKAPDGIEIRFGDARPTMEVRELLKQHGFRFSEKQTMWYAFDNAKSRELIEQLENKEVEVDDTQYEKRSFWKRVSNYDAFAELTPYTEFMVHTNPPGFHRNKKMLQKAYPNIHALLNNPGLSYKKYFNKAVEEGEEKEERDESGEERFEVAKKLQELAEGMQKTIDVKLNPPISRQRPTARRARIAAGIRDEGYRLLDMQTFLFALAKAHREGHINSYPLLKKIRSKAQIAVFDTIGLAEKGNWSQKSIEATYERNSEALASLGIRSLPEWRKANEQKNSLLNTMPQAKKEALNEKKIRELEIKLLSQKIPGFFPTPPDLIERLLELADLDEEDSILEPSAGKGDILDAIREKFGGIELDLSAIEIYSPLREILELKGYELIAGNFLDYNSGEKFNKIVMNPPFEDGQDIDHVTHALSLLTPGGRVVAIMGEGVFFRSFKKDKTFRELLQQKNAYISEPIKEAFKQGFKSTGVNVRIVAINADGTPVKPGQSFPKQKGAQMPQKEEAEELPEEETEPEDADKAELEAQAELELLRMQVEQKRRKRKNLKGVEDIDPEKLEGFKRKAWALQGYGDVLDFK